MKNIVWMNWLSENPTTMWIIIGIIVVLPILVGLVLAIGSRK